MYAEIWPEPDVDVDRGLNTLIRQIRIALGDDASNPTYIRTYPRRGYRFLIQPADEVSAPPSTGRRRVAPLLGAAAIASVAIAVASVAPQFGQSGSGDDRIEAAGLEPAVRERFLEGLYLLDGPAARRPEAARPFRAVIAANPRFGPAHAGLADALFWAGRLEDARAAAQAALDLDPTDARALVVRGTVRLVRDLDRSGAESDLREAVRQEGDQPVPHHALAFALATGGRHNEAIRELQLAHRLDPVSAIVTGDLGLIHLYAGNLEDAARFCERALALEPSANWAAGCAFDAQAHLGRHALARPHAERLVEAAGESPDGILGGADESDAAASRRFREWRADRAAHALSTGGSPWSAALALAGAGRRAEAMSALQQAAAERVLGFVTITIDVRLRPLWSDPAFRRLAADLERRGFAELPS